ncbi:MAG: Kelch repeat-containing protein [Candidatus Solibacter sp.]|nr:Kelch repeat-containing protein [Candidatus Solibacter sp.]
MAQAAGTFTATGSMITRRVGHTATLLPNGKVLMAGGRENAFSNLLLSSAELYDPATGTFTFTGSMNAPRAQHTATLLPDGRVLIAGGSHDLGAEIYDATTGTFAALPEADAPESWAGATTLLKDGSVLIAGQPTAKVYDPTAGIFVVAGPYAGPRPVFIEAALLLPDGQVFLTDIFGWSQIFDPSRRTFRYAGLVDFWYDVRTTTLLASGKILIVGNESNDGLPADAELFNPSDGIFTRLGYSASGHEYAASGLLPDRTVLVTGGQVPGGNGNSAAELYLPESGTFSSAGDMTDGRHQHTLTLLTDGTVLIAGGYSAYPWSTSSAELYRPSVLVPSPMLFYLSKDGKGQGAIWHSTTGEIASPSVPALAGEVLSMYTTSLIEGSPLPPRVAIGGRSAEVVFFGNAPGYPGIHQVNVRVPDGIAPGPAVPVRLTYVGRPSNEVTIAVQ